MTQPRAGHLAMLLFSTLVAGSFALGLLAANDIAPIALNAVRFWIAVIILGAAVVATGGISEDRRLGNWQRRAAGAPTCVSARP